MAHPEMNKKLVTLLLFGYILSAQAMPENVLTLKLDNKLSRATEIISLSHDIAATTKQKAQPQVGKNLAYQVTSPGSKQLLSSDQIALNNHDRSASFKLKLSLSMHKQNMHVSNEPKVIRLQSEKLYASPATRSSTALTPAPSPMVAAIPEEVHSSTALVATKQENSSYAPIPAKQPELKQENLDLHSELFVYFGLLFGILAIWSVLPYYTKIKSYFEVNTQQHAEPVTEAGDNENSAPTTAMVSIHKSSYKRIQYADKRRFVPAAVESFKARTIKDKAPALPPQIISEKEEESKEHSSLIKAENTQLTQDSLPLPSIHEEVIASSQPSMQDEESDNFLADFNPKQNGSVTEFLSSRNAVTFEQLIGWSTCRPVNRPLALRIVGSPAIQM